MEQIMEQLLAEMKVSHKEKIARLRAKNDSHHKELVAIMKAGKENIETKMDVRIEGVQEIWRPVRMSYAEAEK
jgi:hypothetical protein